MAQPQQTPLFTPQAYLDWEVQQPDKHEYIRGEVYAMAGGEDRHQTAGGNVYMLLRQHLSGTPCRVYMSDVRVQTEEAYFYPDVFVTCSARDAQDRLVKREPTLVVEVLSPSTAAFDAGAKFAHYRSVASLQEYALVDLDRRSVDVFRKSPEGLWVLHPHTETDTLELASVKLRCPTAAVFSDLEDASTPAA